MLVVFVAGFLSGFFSQDYLHDKTINLANFVLIIVTVIWATSVVVDITSPTYTTSPLIHGLMGAIVGFFYRPKKES